VRPLGFSRGNVHELFILSDRIYRDKAGESVEPNKLVGDATNGTENEDTFVEKPKASGFSAFSSISLLEDTPVGDDDEGGGGGLMVLFSGTFRHRFIIDCLTSVSDLQFKQREKR